VIPFTPICARGDRHLRIEDYSQAFNLRYCLLESPPMNSHLNVPTWIRKRDGRLALFDPDRICQELFAASERLGQPNAFLARELTDSIVHFLAQESTDGPPTTAELAELVTKVVREMGHPELAQELARRTRSDPDRTLPSPAAMDAATPPHLLTRAAASIPLSEISLTEVFPRNLVAAHREGIITLTGLEHPFELAGAVVNRACDQSRSGMGIREAVESAREYTGRFVAIDGLDHALAQFDGEPHDLARQFAIELSAALRAAGLSAIVNLSVAKPPDCARDLSDGPLFAEFQQTLEPARIAALAEALLSELLGRSQRDDGSVSLAWHLSSEDFMPRSQSRLQWLARVALDGGALEFIFDRPRKPVALGGGLTRQEPALLLAVGVHLPRLTDHAAASSDNYLAKVGTLARLARSAGHAKQDFLRRRGRAAITSGFLLDRARLLVVPVGLEFVVRELTSQSLCDGGAGTHFGVQIARRLREALAAGKRHNLEAVLDSYPIPLTPLAETHTLKERPGLQVADAGISPRHQLDAATALRVSGGSMATLAIPAEPDFSTVEAAALLQYAWTQTEISRLRFERAAQPGRQLCAPWEGQYAN
jgi:hypothetical protein